MYVKTNKPLLLFLKKGALLVLVFFICFIGVVEANQTIQTLPAFEFESFDGSTITQSALTTLNITLIIYGNPDALTNNRAQLDLILEHIKTEGKADQLLYTINFASYPRLIRGIIKNQMKNNARKLGINIYADWDGMLCNHYQLDTNLVAFFLIMEDGMIPDWFYFKNAQDALIQIE